MTDRLRVSGDPIITEDDATGDVTVSPEVVNTKRLSVGGGSETTGTPALAHIETQNGVTGASEITFTGLDSTYKRHVIDINGIWSSSDSDVVQLQVSTDGGDSWDIGASDYRYAGSRNESNAGVNDFGGTDSKILMTDGDMEDAEATPYVGQVKIVGLANISRRTMFRWEATYERGAASDTIAIEQGAGQREVSQSADAVRLFMGTGNISGDVSLYGVIV